MGRPPTSMAAWKDALTPQQIDDVIAYVRSMAAGPVVVAAPPPSPVMPPPSPAMPPPSLAIPPSPVMPPLPPAAPRKGPVVLNPRGRAPEFTPRDGMFVPIDQVKKALDQRRRLVIADARGPAEWSTLRIAGAISTPYYDAKALDDIPNDGTWVLAYCGCPHHLSGDLVAALRKRGYKNTAVIDEGIFAWQQKGYPVVAAPGAPPPPAAPPRRPSPCPRARARRSPSRPSAEGARLSRAVPGAVRVDEVDAFADGWVAGAEEFVERARPRDGEVLPLERHERRRRRVIVARQLETELVRRVFVVARQRQRRGRDQEREQRQQQHQERQRRGVGELGETEPRAEPREQEPRRAVRAVEPEQRQRRRHQDVDPHVAHHVVPELVPDDESCLRRRQPCEQRVPQHDALAVADPCDVRVDLLRVGALVDLEHARALDPRLRRHRQHLALERLVLHRPELVEQRRDEDRGHQQHQREERQRQHSRPQPPPPRTAREQQVRHPEHRRSDDQPDGQPLRLILGPLPEPLGRQAVRVLAHVPDVVRERRLHDREQQRDQHEVHDQRRIEVPAADR